MKHRNPKKLAQRIVGIILLTGGNLIATTLYLPEFRYVPELFERLQMYRAIALVLGITGAGRVKIFSHFSLQALA